MSENVTWTQMSDGTRADYQRLTPLFERHARSNLVGNLVSMLRMLEGPTLGYQVDRLEHSLQSATRAHRNGERIDLVVSALLHDVADSFAPENHSDAAAALLEPYVDAEAHWVVEHHGLFQGYYYFHHFDGDRDARDAYAASEHYDTCVDFCANYDQNCFDPAYASMPLDEFVPMLDEVFARPSSVPGIAPLSAS